MLAIRCYRYCMFKGVLCLRKGGIFISRPGVQAGDTAARMVLLLRSAFKFFCHLRRSFQLPIFYLEEYNTDTKFREEIASPGHHREPGNTLGELPLPSAISLPQRTLS